mmetsp:Transcript_23137/g.68773  ORF Transcript_23137/g.68773 Transcript_23137/m.68773 type:complete len:258 (-) Transcript_23137:59-832(-)
MCSILAMFALMVEFFKRSFSMVVSFCRSFSSRKRRTFSPMILPVRGFSAPMMTSRLNSYVSFLVSAMRMSTSSISVRMSSISLSPACFSCSISVCTSSISRLTMSFFSSSFNRSCVVFGPSIFPFLPAFFFFPNSSSTSIPALLKSILARYASNSKFSRWRNSFSLISCCRNSSCGSAPCSEGAMLPASCSDMFTRSQPDKGCKELVRRIYVSRTLRCPRNVSQTTASSKMDGFSCYKFRWRGPNVLVMLTFFTAGE